jgi:hypothetical protein
VKNPFSSSRILPRSEMQIRKMAKVNGQMSNASCFLTCHPRYLLRIRPQLRSPLLTASCDSPEDLCAITLERRLTFAPTGWVFWLVNPQGLLLVYIGRPDGHGDC